MKAILYARVSTKEQGKSHLGLDAQIAEMQSFCAFHKIEVVDIRTEVVSGGYPLERRPVLKQTLEDIKAVKDCYVITSRIDRLARSSLLIENLIAKSTRFRVVECGIEASVFEIKMKAIFAEEERLKGADRTKRALGAKKLRGEPMGFKLPVQRAKFEEIHSASIKSIQDEADKFAEYMRPRMERMVRDGMSLKAIADELNHYKEPTQRGGKWWPSSVRNLISRWQ